MKLTPELENLGLFMKLTPELENLGVFMKLPPELLVKIENGLKFPCQQYKRS